MKAMLTLLALFAAATPTMASPELAAKRNCMGCHATDAKRVGPAFRDVAAKYAGQPSAAARLATKIRLGGAGAWGQVPMPANPVNPDEALMLATWVLGLK
jgi:cytochrome c